jgi:hypothetical protein
VIQGATPARHELPEIDAAALKVAAALDRLLADARRLVTEGGPGAAGASRWAAYLEALPDQLRDEPVTRLRAAVRRARAAYGPKDSIRDVFDPALTEPLLDAIDRLLRAIARYELNRG